MSPDAITLPPDHPNWPVVKELLLDLQGQLINEAINEQGMGWFMQSIYNTMQLDHPLGGPLKRQLDSMKSQIHLLRKKKLDHTCVWYGVLKFLKKISKEEKEKFVYSTLPRIIEIALGLEDLRPAEALVIMKQQQDGCTTLSRQFVCAIVACCFLCLFPERKREKSVNVNSINFTSFFKHLPIPTQVTKLQCILHYFECIIDRGMEVQGDIMFCRKVMPWTWLLNMEELLRYDLALCPLTTHSMGSMEDCGSEVLQVDFAYKLMDGAALGRTQYQEETRFSTCPELLASVLLMEHLQDNESILVSGFEQFSYCTGYTGSLQYAGHYKGNTSQEAGSSGNCLVAIDSISCRTGPPTQQYEEGALLRDLNKALVAFSRMGRNTSSLLDPGTDTQTGEREFVDIAADMVTTVMSDALRQASVSPVASDSVILTGSQHLHQLDHGQQQQQQQQQPSNLRAVDGQLFNISQPQVTTVSTGQPLASADATDISRCSKNISDISPEGLDMTVWPSLSTATTLDATPASFSDGAQPRNLLNTQPQNEQRVASCQGVDNQQQFHHTWTSNLPSSTSSEVRTKLPSYVADQVSSPEVYDQLCWAETSSPLVDSSAFESAPPLYSGSDQPAVVGKNLQPEYETSIVVCKVDFHSDILGNLSRSSFTGEQDRNRCQTSGNLFATERLQDLELEFSGDIEHVDNASEESKLLKEEIISPSLNSISEQTQVLQRPKEEVYAYSVSREPESILPGTLEPVDVVISLPSASGALEQKSLDVSNLSMVVNFDSQSISTNSAEEDGCEKSTQEAVPVHLYDLRMNSMDSYLELPPLSPHSSNSSRNISPNSSFVLHEPFHSEAPSGHSNVNVTADFFVPGTDHSENQEPGHHFRHQSSRNGSRDIYSELRDFLTSSSSGSGCPVSSGTSAWESRSGSMSSHGTNGSTDFLDFWNNLRRRSSQLSDTASRRSSSSKHSSDFSTDLEEISENLKNHSHGVIEEEGGILSLISDFASQVVSVALTKGVARGAHISSSVDELEEDRGKHKEDKGIKSFSPSEEVLPKASLASTVPAPLDSCHVETATTSTAQVPMEASVPVKLITGNGKPDMRTQIMVSEKGSANAGKLVRQDVVTMDLDDDYDGSDICAAESSRLMYMSRGITAPLKAASQNTPEGSPHSCLGPAPLDASVHSLLQSSQSGSEEQYGSSSRSASRKAAESTCSQPSKLESESSRISSVRSGIPTSQKSPRFRPDMPAEMNRKRLASKLPHLAESDCSRSLDSGFISGQSSVMVPELSTVISPSPDSSSSVGLPAHPPAQQEDGGGHADPTLQSCAAPLLIPGEREVLYATLETKTIYYSAENIPQPPKSEAAESNVVAARAKSSTQSAGPRGRAYLTKETAASKSHSSYLPKAISNFSSRSRQVRPLPSAAGPSSPNQAHTRVETADNKTSAIPRFRTASHRGGASANTGVPASTKVSTADITTKTERKERSRGGKESHHLSQSSRSKSGRQKAHTGNAAGYSKSDNSGKKERIASSPSKLKTPSVRKDKLEKVFWPHKSRYIYSDFAAPPESKKERNKGGSTRVGQKKGHTESKKQEDKKKGRHQSKEQNEQQKKQLTDFTKSQTFVRFINSIAEMALSQAVLEGAEIAAQASSAQEEVISEEVFNWFANKIINEVFFHVINELEHGEYYRQREQRLVRIDSSESGAAQGHITSDDSESASVDNVSSQSGHKNVAKTRTASRKVIHRMTEHSRSPSSAISQPENIRPTVCSKHDLEDGESKVSDTADTVYLKQHTGSSQSRLFELGSGTRYGNSAEPLRPKQSDTCSLGGKPVYSGSTQLTVETSPSSASVRASGSGSLKSNNTKTVSFEDNEIEAYLLPPKESVKSQQDTSVGGKFPLSSFNSRAGNNQVLGRNRSATDLSSHPPYSRRDRPSSPSTRSHRQTRTSEQPLPPPLRHSRSFSEFRYSSLAGTDLSVDVYQAAVSIVNQVFESISESMDVQELSPGSSSTRHRAATSVDATAHYSPGHRYRNHRDNFTSNIFSSSSAKSSGSPKHMRRSVSPGIGVVSRKPMSRETLTSAFLRVDSTPSIKSYERRSSEPCQTSVQLSLQAFNNNKFNTRTSEKQRKISRTDDDIGRGRTWRRGSLDGYSFERRNSCGFKDPVLSRFAEELMKADMSVPELVIVGSHASSSTTGSRRSSISGFRDTTLANLESELLNTSFTSICSLPLSQSPRSQFRSPHFDRYQSRDTRQWRSDSSDAEYWFPPPRHVGEEFQIEFERQRSQEELQSKSSKPDRDEYSCNSQSSSCSSDHSECTSSSLLLSSSSSSSSESIGPASHDLQDLQQWMPDLPDGDCHRKAMSSWTWSSHQQDAQDDRLDSEARVSQGVDTLCQNFPKEIDSGRPRIQSSQSAFWRISKKKTCNERTRTKVKTKGVQASEDGGLTSPVINRFAASLSQSIVDNVMQHCREDRWLRFVSYNQPIATGSCRDEALRGDTQVKMVIQWIAASVAQAPMMLYYTHGDPRLIQAENVLSLISGWKVGHLMTALLDYCSWVRMHLASSSTPSSREGLNAAHPACHETILPQSLFDFLRDKYYSER